MLQLPRFSNERFRRLSREGLWIIVGQGVAVLGTLVGVRIVTELLNPATYGELALGMTVAALVNQTVFGPLANGVARFYAPAHEQHDLAEYGSAIRTLARAATGLVSAVLILALAIAFTLGKSNWILLVLVVFIFALASGYGAILTSVQNAARQRAIVALHQAVESWARYLLAAGFVVFVARTSTSAIAGYASAATLVCLSQQYFLRHAIPRHALKEAAPSRWRQQILKYSAPFGIWGIFTWAQAASDRWALGYFATTQEVGLYAALFQIGYYPVSLATGLTVQFLIPIFFQRAGDATDPARTAAVNRLSNMLTGTALAGTGLAFVVALALHRRIFQLVVAHEYEAVSSLLPWMILAGGVYASSQVVALDLMSQLKTQLMMAARLTTAVLGIAFNFAGAYFYSIRGIVATSVLFSTANLIWMLALRNSSRSTPVASQL